MSDRAVIVYSQRAREAYKDVPIILGGLEGVCEGMLITIIGKTEFAIYSPGFQSGSLVYGMGERAVVEIAEALDGGIDVKHISWIPGTVYRKTVSMEELDAEFPGRRRSFCLPSKRCPAQKPTPIVLKFNIGITIRSTEKSWWSPMATTMVVTNPPMPPLEPGPGRYM